MKKTMAAAFALVLGTSVFGAGTVIAAGSAEAWKKIDGAVAGLEGTTDAASIMAAFAALAGACNGCHDTVRAAES